MTRSHNPTIGCAGSRHTDRNASELTVNTTVARIEPAGRTSHGYEAPPKSALAKVLSGEIKTPLLNPAWARKLLGGE